MSSWLSLQLEDRLSSQILACDKLIMKIMQSSFIHRFIHFSHEWTELRNTPSFEILRGFQNGLNAKFWIQPQTCYNSLMSFIHKGTKYIAARRWRTCGKKFHGGLNF